MLDARASCCARAIASGDALELRVRAIAGGAVGVRRRSAGGGGVGFGGRARSMLASGESSNVAGTPEERGGTLEDRGRTALGVGVRPIAGAFGVGVRPTIGAAFEGAGRAVFGGAVGVRTWDDVRATTECGGALPVCGRPAGGGVVAAA